MYVYYCQFPNGKKYIGATTKNPGQSRNYFGSHPQLKKDKMEVMSSQIQKEILFETDNVEELKDLELLAIRQHNAVADSRYYNESEHSVFPMYGKVNSAEHRKRISDSNMGRIHSEQTKRKIGEARKGIPRDRLSILKRQITTIENGLYSIKGYTLDNGRYQARAKINGVQKHLGCYDTAEEAHAVSLKARKQHLSNLKTELEALNQKDTSNNSSYPWRHLLGLFKWIRQPE